MKFKRNNKIAVYSLLLGLIFLMSIIFSKTNWIDEMKIGWHSTILILALWSVTFGFHFTYAFLKTRSYEIVGDELRTNYIFNLFPKRYNLNKVINVNFEVKEVMGKSILLLYGINEVKKLIVVFNNGKKLKIDGNILLEKDLALLKSRLLLYTKNKRK